MGVGGEKGEGGPGGGGVGVGGRGAGVGTYAGWPGFVVVAVWVDCGS